MTDAFGAEVLQREALCAALALIFTATVVIPGILIFWDRALPFEYVDATIVEKAASPGDRVHFRLTVRKVDKECRGRVDRVFVDSTGRVFPLNDQPTAYQFFPSRGDLRTIERAFRIPEEAATGEAAYVSFPEFWCYPLQFLFPVKAPTLRAKVTVVPKGTVIGDPSKLIVMPPAAIR